MLLDSRLVPETIVKPRSFVGLMSIYESNYLRLLHLVPDLDLIDGCFRSRVAGDCDLHVDVLERERYTVTLSLTYRFDDGESVMDDPDLRVRVYLDCQLAEASFDEARRRFSPGIFMALLPGRFAQHEKDIGRGRGEANRARARW